MKVTRAAVTILVMVVSAVEPQFTRFPALPSPPRIFFGGFRPIFRPRFRPRPRLRPPPVFRQSRRPFFQQPDQTMLPPPLPSPRSLQRPQPAPQVVIRQPQQQPSPPRVVVSPQQRPNPPQPTRDARGFGSLKPNSILTTFRPSSSASSTVGQQFSTRQPAASLVVAKEISNGFPRPLSLQNDNNIIGMFPPPLPLFTTTLAPPVVVAQTTAPLPPPVAALFTTATTSSITSPTLGTSRPKALISLTSSNSIVNELPLLNAGVLPLAGEDENEHMLFPPFNHLGLSSDLLSNQELFPPFPSNQDLFPPFDNNEN